MDQVPEEDDQNFQIGLRKPFQPKFIKELNQMQNEKHKKNKRKFKEQSVSPHIKQKYQSIGLKSHLKSMKKLPETLRNGHKIYGQWKNNQINGQAEVHYSNGVTFRGVYHNGIKIKGHFTFLHGYQYIGHCLGNKFNGQGSLIFPSGKIITGEWKDYNLVEKGKIQYPNGQVYYGEIQNLKKHGQGHLFFQDGSKYVGQFLQGQITGFGTYYKNDQPVCKGYWADGELQEEIDLDEKVSEKEMKSFTELKKSQKQIKKNHRRVSIEKGKFRRSSGSRDKSPGQKKLRFAQQIYECQELEIVHQESNRS